MRDAPTTTARPRRGFTLTELMVVMAIVGILITFILIAAGDGIRRAEEKATQALIAKLEMGLSERIEAMLTRRADISLGHQYLSAVINTNFPSISTVNDPNYLSVIALNNYFGTTSFTTSILSPQRAQAIAQIDRYRADLPDVFFVQSGLNATYGANYPLNFAGANFPVNGTDNYLIPIGAYSGGAPGKPSVGPSPTGLPAGVSFSPGDPNQAIGIFGATWQAAGGIYKNLGYLPKGYDGADNDGDTLVDEFDEGTTLNGTVVSVADPDNPSTTIGLNALVLRRLGNHKHNTARSEMLYALLVEGIGPLGSVFSRDEFSNRQVADTDFDGLPEFIDAWRQPLQFFRWPIYYNNLSSTTVSTATIVYSGTSQAPDRLRPEGGRPLQRRLGQHADDAPGGGPADRPARPEPDAHGAGLVVVERERVPASTAADQPPRRRCS